MAAAGPSRSEMEKYKRVKKNDQLEKEDSREDVIRISAKGRTSNYVSYAAKLFSDAEETVKDEETGEDKPVKKFDKFTIKATGQALATAVTVAEIIKRRFKGIHQTTKIGSLEVNDEYELKEGETGEDDKELDPTITQVRHISFIEIELSKVEPAEKSTIGYQPPLPDDQVNEKSMDELIGETKGGRPSGGGRGRGGKGGRGSKPEKKDDEKSEKKSEKKDDKKDSKKGGGKKGGKGKGKGKKGKGKGKKGKGKGKGGDSDSDDE